jgi:hypothetical protein
MAHFFVYVLVSGSTIDLRRRVHYLMAPYHNEFEVEEYETECEGDCRRDESDRDCGACNGRYLTTWNPMCKFDGYAIWDSAHVLRNASRDPSDWEEEEVFDDDIPDDDGAAIAPLSSLDTDRLRLPFAIVTPSGEWHEMDGDWWSEDTGCGEWEDWRRIAHDLYSKWPNSIVVVLNCHR